MLTTPDRSQSDARHGGAASMQARLQGVFAAMAEGVVIHARDGRIVDANAAAEQVLGLSRDELLGRTSVDPAWRAIRADGSPFPGVEHPAMITLRTGRPLRNQLMGVRYASEQPRWISINSQPLPDTGDPDAAVIATFVDVTRQRLAFEQIRALAQRLEHVREVERRAVADELHEGIAQELFAMRLTIQRLATACESLPEAHALCDDLARGLEKCMADARQVANDLRPSGLAHLRLSKALAEHAAYFGEIAELGIDVTEVAPFPELDESTRLLLFRAAQEALTNIARHASATRVEITLVAGDERVTMHVADDGIGIEEGAMSKPGSLGLLGLRERFRALGGGVQVRRRAESGTTLSVFLPRHAP